MRRIVELNAFSDRHFGFGCCQTNSNQSQYAAKCQLLCRTKLAPLSQSGGTVQSEIYSVVEMALLIEMVVDCAVNCDEFL